LLARRCARVLPKAVEQTHGRRQQRLSTMAQLFHDARKEGLTFLFFLGLIAFTFFV